MSPPLHFTHENRKARCILQPGSQASNRLIGRGVWNVLHAMGHFPPSTPESMRAALLRGQRSIEELVDQYEISNQSVRGLLIEYFTRRKADTDYSTLKDLICKLTRHFWKNIETINSDQADQADQADLRISPEDYTTWRQMITVKDDGKPRVGQDSIVIALRSFYYDLHTWAAQEPERWAAWVAPCPVPPAELRGLGARRRRVNERSADRTRQRQPLLPFLVNHVETRYDRARLLLGRAGKVAEGEAFIHEGIEYRRIRTEADRKLLRHGDEVPTRVQEVASGRIVHIGTDEEAAFWEWATVETLRHSGVRIEELCELTHLSIRQYQRANGEVIALLIIAPSKTDRERVIPMSAELFHVIASVVRRHTRSGRTIPLVSRFDYHDKVWSAPMPFLFQRQNGTTPMVFSSATFQVMLGRLCEQLAETHHEFRGLKFTPHDFRRIFATELVNSGLPIHIGAALLGHLNIQTTRGYVAVFDEDVVRHYQEHLQHRPQIRPDGEYRATTNEEWSEFEEHFDRRKVELGSCGRPYGTPCQHEHACLSELAEGGGSRVPRPLSPRRVVVKTLGERALAGVSCSGDQRSTPAKESRGVSAPSVGRQCRSQRTERVPQGARVARERRGRSNRLAYNQHVAFADTSKIVSSGVVLSLIAWGLDDLTHGFSWMGLAVLLTASWIHEAVVGNRVAAAWNLRVSAEDAPGMNGAPTPAYSMRVENDETILPGVAVPLVTGGIFLFSDRGVARQYPPSEILKIDRSLLYNRIQITTTSRLRPIILIHPQSWNVQAWQGLKDRDSFGASE